jgi:rhodanese-related sulfurtransferase
MPKHRILAYAKGCIMLPSSSISTEALARLIGTPGCPVLIDVRTADDFAASPMRVPGSIRRPPLEAGEWARTFAGTCCVTICQKGLKLSEGAAAWLRHAGADAKVLAGGFEAWAGQGRPCVPDAKVPRGGGGQGTLWVTRERPKIDRIACPWLIRRFIDRDAVFLFVAPSEVASVAERFGAAAFDVEGVFWSHRGERCSFDTMIDEFGLETPALTRLARIVRAADTARPELAPEAAGLLAVSLGYSLMYADDVAQLAAGLPLYDALYRWCRDGAGETHNWPVPGAASNGELA